MNFYALLLASSLSLPLFAAPGVVVLAGGEAEGDIGETTSWSYPLYKRLVQNGDKTGDNKIKVVVLSLEQPSTNFMVDYFKDLGADSSENLVISSRSAANDPKIEETLKEADVVFIRGGNQGRAYQDWKGTRLHQELRKLGERGGAIGGTSSGAMGLSEYSITGGQDFDSREVLADSHSILLNDQKEMLKSGIHNDFLNMAPNLLVDTHCGERGRIGRLLSTMAKAIDDYKNPNIVAVCLEERTGIVIENGKAKVYGTGGAHFLSENSETKKERIPGKPLSYSNVRSDVLTDGWTYEIAARSPDLTSAPKDTKELIPVIDCSSVNPFLEVSASSKPRITFTSPLFTSGITVSEDAYSDALLINGDLKKGIMQTYALEKMANNPNDSVIMLDSSSALKGLDRSNVTITGVIPSLILDCRHCTHTSKSPYVAFLDSGDKSLHTSALVNLRLHVISAGDTYNVQNHKVTLAANKDENCQLEALSTQVIDELIKDGQAAIKNYKCLQLR